MQETKASLDEVLEEMQSKQSEALVELVERSVSACAHEQFSNISTQCESLMATVSSSHHHHRQTALEATDASTREMMVELQARLEQDRESSEASLLLLIDKKLERQAAELEARTEKRMEKKIMSTVERKAKQDVDIGKHYHRFRFCFLISDILSDSKVAEALAACTSRCLEETRSAINELREELQTTKASEVAAAEARRADLSSSMDQFNQIKLQCDTLLASTSESIAQLQQQLQQFQAESTSSTRSMIEELRQQQEHQQDTFESSVAQLVDKKLEKIGIELESRVEKRVDRKIGSAVDRKTKLDGEIGKFLQLLFAAQLLN